MKHPWGFLGCWFIALIAAVFPLLVFAVAPRIGFFLIGCWLGFHVGPWSEALYQHMFLRQRQRDVHEALLLTIERAVCTIRGRCRRDPSDPAAWIDVDLSCKNEIRILELLHLAQCDPAQPNRVFLRVYANSGEPHA